METLKLLRTEKGLSMRQVASKVGVTERTLWSVENEKGKVIKSDLLTRLADFYGVSTDFILGRTDASKVR